LIVLLVWAFEFLQNLRRGFLPRVELVWAPGVPGTHSYLHWSVG
jgi:hypothetical protein